MSALDEIDALRRLAAIGRETEHDAQERGIPWAMGLCARVEAGDGFTQNLAGSGGTTGVRDEIASALRAHFTPWTPTADEIHAYVLADVVLSVPGVATALRLQAAADEEVAQLRAIAVEALAMVMDIVHYAFPTDSYDLPYRVERLREAVRRAIV